jgi:hypothetical protein
MLAANCSQRFMRRIAPQKFSSKTQTNVIWATLKPTQNVRDDCGLWHFKQKFSNLNPASHHPIANPRMTCPWKSACATCTTWAITLGHGDGTVRDITSFISILKQSTWTSGAPPRTQCGPSQTPAAPPGGTWSVSTRLLPGASWQRRWHRTRNPSSRAVCQT